MEFSCWCGGNARSVAKPTATNYRFFYIDATAILGRVKDFVVFVEGDNQNLIINDDFVRNIDMINKNNYYKYEKTYLPYVQWL